MDRLTDSQTEKTKKKTSKIFERLILNKIRKLELENEIISKWQNPPIVVKLQLEQV